MFLHGIDHFLSLDGGVVELGDFMSQYVRERLDACEYLVRGSKNLKT